MILNFRVSILIFLIGSFFFQGNAFAQGEVLDLQERILLAQLSEDYYEQSSLRDELGFQEEIPENFEVAQNDSMNDWTLEDIANHVDLAVTTTSDDKTLQEPPENSTENSTFDPTEKLEEEPKENLLEDTEKKVEDQIGNQTAEKENHKTEERTQPPETQDPLEVTSRENADQDTPARTVRFDLTPVEGSIGYDVELAPVDRAWKKHHKFKIKGAQLRVRLSPGRYRVRTRSYNVENDYGPWGKWKDFSISYRAPTNIYPAESATIRPISKANEKIIFEWPEIPGTFAYLFEIRTDDGSLIERKVIKNYFRTVDLPINQKYRWSVFPLVYEGEDKFINELTIYNSFEITKPIPNTTPVVIEVSKNKVAFKYEYEFVRFTSYTETTPPTIYESVIPEFRASLEPGEYELRVRAVYRDETKSDWSPATRFFVEFTSAAAQSPEPNEKVPARHPKKNPVEVSWFPVSKAKRYILYIYNEQGEVIEKIDTEKTKTLVRVPAGSRYFYHVQAYSPNEKERKPPPIGDRTVAFEVENFIYREFSEAEEPANVYGWLNWVGSTIDYKSKNFDNNSLTTNNIFGGTGQVAIGFWERHTKFGLLGFAELSGFTIGDKNYLYQTYGLQFGKRFILDQGARARFWLGWATKDLPELLTRPFTSFLDVQQITASGVFIQGNYLKPWFDDYSLYFNANYFQDIGQNKTPNGLKLEYLRGGTIGAYISKKFGSEYRGRLGYSYRFDSSSYGSTEIGAKNRVDITGHYLSVLFEFAITESDEY